MATITKLFVADAAGNQIYLTQNVEGDPNRFEEGESITLRDADRRPIINAYRIEAILSRLGLEAMPRGANIEKLREYISSYRFLVGAVEEGEYERLEAHLPMLWQLAKEVAPGFETGAERFLAPLLPLGYRNACEKGIAAIYSSNPLRYDVSGPAERVCAKLPADEQPALKTRIANAVMAAYYRLSREALGTAEQSVAEADFDRLDRALADAARYGELAKELPDPRRVRRIYQFAVAAALKKMGKAAEVGARKPLEQAAQAARTYGALLKRASVDAKVEALLAKGYRRCAERALGEAEWWLGRVERDDPEDVREMEKDVRGGVETARACLNRATLTLGERQAFSARITKLLLLLGE